MGELMASLDWSKTSVGPTDTWPQSLRTVVSIVLESKFPMYVAWGPEYIQFYNDGYRPILGSTKHPAAMGARASDTFAESWHIIGPMFDGVMAGNAVGSEDWMLPLDRHGFLEECYFTFSYSPIRAESGDVGGVHVTVTETTERVLHDRRLRTLRDLAAHAATVANPDAAWTGALDVLAANDGDVGFVAAFALDADGSPRPVGSPSARLDDPERWPLVDEQRVVEDVRARVGSQVGTKWPEPVERAIVLPIARPGQPSPYGHLVIGLSNRLALDDDYRSFADLVADQLATAVANSRAQEEERLRREALLALDRAKTAFFSNVSHEFRTPLTLILGPIRDAVAASERRLEGDDLELVHRNALRLLDLVNTLLDFSRIESGRIDAKYERTDLAALTEDLGSTFRSLLENANLRFEIDCPPLSDPTFVDRDMWEKIVLNLLSNAYKFTFEGAITLRLRSLGDAVELSVADTGVGIAESEMPRVFERFHRIEGTRSRTHEGTGIGLALVKDLVDQHGGVIEVDSAVGRGTIFRVRIPTGAAHLPSEKVVDDVPEAPSVRREAHAAAAFGWTQTDDAGDAPKIEGGDRILLADDNADLRQYVAGLLREAGWNVTTAADGDEALRLAREAPPDLILADVMMPNLDGFGLLAALRAEARTMTIPVIMLSARAGEEARVEGFSAGVDDYLIKPFSAKELVARVNTHLQLTRLRTAAAAAGARLHDLFMQSPVAISVLKGPDHRYELANDRYLEMVNKKGIVGRPIGDVFPEIVGTPLMTLFDSVYKTGEPFSTDEYATALERGGVLEDCFFKFNLVPIREDDAIIGMMATAVEITDQVNARREAEESRRLLEAVVEQMPTGVLVADAKTKDFLLANPAVEGLFGPIRAAKDPTASTHHPDAPLSRALSGEVVRDVERRSFGADGTEHFFLASASPVYGEGEELIAAVAAFSDITERKAAEAQRRDLLEKAEAAQAEAERANRAKDQFLAMLGHELRNPLAPMLTALQLMKLHDEHMFDKERRIIERQARHLVHLVDDLLDVSRIARGGIELKKEPANLEELVARALEMASPALEQKEHSVQVDVPESITLNVDPGRIAQVICNLVTNAAKYTDKRGSITIEAEEIESEVVLRVRDTGIGISADILPSVFEAFVQEEQALDRSQGGLGLGLAIVRSVVDLHGGRVEVASEGRNRGSLFTVRLPASGDRTSRPAAPRTVDLPATRSSVRRILVVDDNQDAADMLAMGISALGHEVRTAHDGAEALEVVERFVPDLALLDIGLPVMNGYELAKRLRATRGLEDVALVALTGYGQASDQRQSIEAGFDVHLTKPVTLHQIASIIEELGAGRRASPPASLSRSSE